MKLQKPLVKRITIPYFPSGLRIASLLLPMGTFYLIMIHHYAWAVVLLGLSVIILTTHYVTEIDLAKKQYSDYLFLLGLKLNAESAKFTYAEKIVITKGNYSQTVNTRIQSRTMKWTDYSGTLLFRGTQSLDLLTHTNKKKLIIKLKEFADYLQVDIEDRSTGYPHWIDLNKVH